MFLIFKIKYVQYKFCIGKFQVEDNYSKCEVQYLIMEKCGRGIMFFIFFGLDLDFKSKSNLFSIEN